MSKVLIIGVLLMISIAISLIAVTYVNQPIEQHIDVDMHNDKGDHFIGTAIYMNNELTYYNITCYVNRDDGNSRTTGKIYITTNGDTGLAKTTYDLYLTEDGWAAHFHGDAPMLKYEVGFGEFQQESYLKCPAYSVHLIDGEIVIDHNVVESFELLN